MNTKTVDTVKQQLILFGIAKAIEQLFPNAVQDGNGYMLADVGGSKGKSLKIDIQKGFWIDFATNDKGGDIIDLWKAHQNFSSKSKAAADLATKLGIEADFPKPSCSKQNKDKNPLPVPPDAPQPSVKIGMPFPGTPQFELVKMWKYLNESGELLHFVLRYEKPTGKAGEKPKKKIIPYTYDREKKRWVMKVLKGCAAILYGLQNLAEHPDKPVLLVEGEKQLMLLLSYSQIMSL